MATVSGVGACMPPTYHHNLSLAGGYNQSPATGGSTTPSMGDTGESPGDVVRSVDGQSIIGSHSWGLPEQQQQQQHNPHSYLYTAPPAPHNNIFPASGGHDSPAVGDIMDTIPMLPHAGQCY